MEPQVPTGGCQCGAVRFAVRGGLGRPSVCHCRMCQKAFGNAFAPLVTARGLVWTRGAPRYFRSSNLVRRGFCGDCGTPLSYEPDGLPPEVAVGAFDHPAALPPAVQLQEEQRLPWVAALPALPGRPPGEVAAQAPFFARIVSYQQPDDDGPAPVPPGPPPLAVVAVLTIRREALADFRRHEAHAAAVMGRHGGALVRTIVVDPDPAAPVLKEIHLLTFPDAAALARYQADPALADTAEARARAIVDTELLVGAEGPRARVGS